MATGPGARHHLLLAGVAFARSVLLDRAHGHPTCRTSEADLQDLLRLVERHGDRAAFKVFPEASLLDRSSNLLCLCGADGDAAVSVGPTENMGFAPASPSQANLAAVVQINPVMVAA